MYDELKQPLRRRGHLERLWQQRPAPLATAFAALFVVYAAGGIWLIRQHAPLAGEPVVTASIPQLEIIHPALPKPMDGSADPDQIETSATDQAQPFPPPTRQKPPKTDNRVTIITPPRPVLVKAPVPGVTEDTPLGPLPRIAANGRKPSDIYAKSASLNDQHSDGPKIVLIIGGMGLNEKLTRRAISDLPSDVTFAFAPYGNNLQAQVDKARDEGHEVMLQLPMEPVGYPANNPGQKTLLADADAASNGQSLAWLMSRFAGYVGAVNYMGGRFMAAPNAVKPLLSELKARGLLFVEDGSLPASALDQTAGTMNYPVRHAAVVIDQAADPASIAAALDQLEKEAEDGSIAIGTGTGLDVTIDAVRDWLQGAADRGIVVLPASAAFKGKQG
jgi:polysaccharide deacetylase 2 family uncharacterized protein YibQ